MASFGLLFLVSTLAGSDALPALSKAYVTGTLVNKIRNTVQTWPTRVAGGLLRLSFHDCAGDACDGCVNTTLKDNAGLDDPVAAMEWLYANMSLASKMSRADLWALAGTVVAFDAMKKANGQASIPTAVDPANFKYGRVDCGTAPKSATDVSAFFPGAIIGSSAVQQYFKDRFNYTKAETVAIMGAHHVGRMHQEYSGFNGPWTVTNGAMDGSYYSSLKDATLGWRQRVVNCSAAIEPINLKVQWVDNNPPPGGRNMLNADMALYKDIGTAHPNGAVACTYSSCGFSPMKTDVETYAGNKNKFQTDFADVFTRMIRVCSRDVNGFPTFCPLNTMAP